MAGQKITRLRRMLREAKAEAALLEKKGEPGAAEARAKANGIRAELDDELKFRASVVARNGGKRLDVTKAASPKPPKPEVTPSARKRQALRILGKKPNPFATEEEKFDMQVSATAAEIAVAGVRKDFAAVIPGPPDPLTPEEFETARDIVITVSGEQGGMNLLTTGSVDVDRWLAEAFPSLPPDKRVRCARFLSAMATMAAESPSDGSEGATIAEKALKVSGMSYVALENARAMDPKFDDAQAAIRAARKRCVMDRLEEALQDRALNGQMEETVDRFGQTHEARKYDNALAFNMLRAGHKEYGEKAIKDKAAANAMTLMIANGNFPQSPSYAPQPKVVEVKVDGE